MKKIIAIILLSLSLTALCGCSSFDDKPIKNAMDDYFEWFEDLVNGKEDSKEEKEDKLIENEETSVSFLI